MPRIHLIVGPVGAGKSTLALALAREHGALRLTLDEWMVTLFSPDRPQVGLVEWYEERSERCLEQIWRLAERVIGLGGDVILEIGLLRRAEREAVYWRADALGLALTIYVVDAPRELRRARVLARNDARGETFAMVVPPHVFEFASDRWEPLGEREREGRDVRVITTG